MFTVVLLVLLVLVSWDSESKAKKKLREIERLVDGAKNRTVWALASDVKRVIRG